MTKLCKLRNLRRKINISKKQLNNWKFWIRFFNLFILKISSFLKYSLSITSKTIVYVNILNFKYKFCSNYYLVMVSLSQRFQKISHATNSSSRHIKKGHTSTKSSKNIRAKKKYKNENIFCPLVWTFAKKISEYFLFIT